MALQTKGWLGRALLLMLTLSLGGTGFFLWRRGGLGARSPEDPAGPVDVRIPVTVAPVTRGAIERRISLSGTLYPQAEVVLYPKLAGRIESLWAERGDRVAAGKPLARLEDREWALQVAEARAALEASQAQLAQLESGARPEEVAQARARIDRTRAAYENARTRLVRMEGLFQEGIISREQLEEARLQQTTALAELSTAQEALKLLLQGARKEDKEAAAAQVKRARATLRLAESRLYDATLRAPLGGVISARPVEIGSLVSPTTPVFTLVQIDAVRARAGVTEREAGLVRVGLPAEVRVDGYPGMGFPGRVFQISPVVSPTSRTFEVEVSLENRSGRLKPGMYARIDLRVQQRLGVLRIPRDALMETGNGAQIFVHRGGRARLLQVETGLEASDLVEVRGPAPRGGPPALQEGDEVILTGLKELQDGTPVIVTGGG